MKTDLWEIEKQTILNSHLIFVFPILYFFCSQVCFFNKKTKQKEIDIQIRHLNRARVLMSGFFLKIKRSFTFSLTGCFSFQFSVFISSKFHNVFDHSRQLIWIDNNSVLIISYSTLFYRLKALIHILFIPEGKYRVCSVLLLIKLTVSRLQNFIHHSSKETTSADIKSVVNRFF